MFLIQMAGFPGSGKSTLAKEISKHIDVVVIDRDVIKSSMTESGVDLAIVANASYNVVYSLCRYYLSINKSVIIDTPCFYEETVENGIKIAKEYRAKYKYIECRLEDFDEISNRLRTRQSSISQINSAEKEQFFSAIDKSKKPANYKHLSIDSSVPIESNIRCVLAYLEESDSIAGNYSDNSNYM
jgi:predicted kinase